MNIDQEKLATVVDYLVTDVWGFENASQQVTSWDTDDLNTVIQELLGANSSTPFVLPDDAEAVAYYITDGDGDGFIFALRPNYRTRQAGIDWLVQVAGTYTGARELEPCDEDYNNLWDGGKISAESVVRQIAENVAGELEPLMPAYEKLFGGEK